MYNGGDGRERVTEGRTRGRREGEDGRGERRGEGRGGEWKGGKGREGRGEEGLLFVQSNQLAANVGKELVDVLATLGTALHGDEGVQLILPVLLDLLLQLRHVFVKIGL